MWLIKIGLIFIAFLNGPLSEMATVEATGAVTAREASGGFDRYGTCSIAEFPASPEPESKGFDALAPFSPDSGEFQSPSAKEGTSGAALQRLPKLTHFNKQFKLPLYEIRGNGTAKSAYLLGSSHNVPLESYPEIVGQVAAMADVLGCEIMSEESLLSPKMVEFGLYNDSGFHWLSKLTTRNREKLDTLSASMDKYHPALVYFLFSRMGVNVFRQGDGINSQLQSAFSLQGKQRFALETRQERVAMGTGIDPRVLMPYARTFSLSGESLNSHFTKFCDEIRSEGPLEDIQSYATSDQEALGDLHPIYHAARNEKWLPRILDSIHSRFPDQVILIDVGFLHLPGDKGLLRLLEQESYVVTRMESPLQAEGHGH